jgi:P-type Cu2+ transporter
MRHEEHPHDHTHHGHDMDSTIQATHAPTSHLTHPTHTRAVHDKHAGHTPAMFRDRFWPSLLFTLPILYFDAHFQAWFGYQAVQFPGVAWVQPLLSAVLYLYGGGVFVQGAVAELRDRQPGMMTLIGLAISVAFVYSVAVSVGLLRGMPLYWELATLIVIMLLGHWIEMASIQGASRALEHLAALVPAEAHRMVGDRVEDVPVSELRVGDWVLIRPGEQIPVDGVVLDGASSVNEAFLTGESRPVPKEKGAEVIAGAVNGEGALVVEVQRTGEATTLSQIRRLVEEAQQSRSRFQALADRAAFWLTVIALGAGSLTLAVWLVLGVPRSLPSPARSPSW